jgi:transposase
MTDSIGRSTSGSPPSRTLLRSDASNCVSFQPQTSRRLGPSIKEILRQLWSYQVEGSARRFFDGWYDWAIRSRLEPLKAVARMLSTRLDNVITYCRHAITTAVAEGLNSRIMAITRRAGGYRNQTKFKTVIYFYCGGLRLRP